MGGLVVEDTVMALVVAVDIPEDMAEMNLEAAEVHLQKMKIE
jgi:hypothetical protein